MQRTERFLGLDFLRGGAALCVVLLHWCDGVGLPWFGYGYLAVEFFFLLSGFVIAHSYEARLLGTMPFGYFMRVRFVRLYPMILAGVAAGLFRFVIRTHLVPEAHGSASEYLHLSVANALMIPVWHSTDLVSGSGPGTAYPLDQPLWSLFYEGLAYVVYAACIRRFSKTALVGITLTGLVGLIVVISTGWVNSDTIPVPFAAQAPRVIFSFFFGVLIYRLHNGMHLRFAAAGPLALSVILIAILALPKGHNDLWFEIGTVAVGFPVILVLGANHQPIGFGAWAGKLIGDLSYPVYALHVPLLWMITGGLKVVLHYDRISPVLLGAFAVTTVCILSWLALKLYDEPMRRWLSGVVLPKRPDPHLISRNG
jgi:peptidoglycan/LPS O-acetylase OafA/YrhL